MTAWEPGRRLALTWTQVGWRADVATDLEITFEPVGEGTLVRVERVIDSKPMLSMVQPLSAASSSMRSSCASFEVTPACH